MKKGKIMKKFLLFIIAGLVLTACSDNAQVGAFNAKGEWGAETSQMHTVTCAVPKAKQTTVASKIVDIPKDCLSKAIKICPSHKPYNPDRIANIVNSKVQYQFACAT